MICCFSISIALMLLSVGSRPMPRHFLYSHSILFLLCESERARALVRKRIHVCAFFLYSSFHYWPAFSCRPNLKNLSIRKKIVVINFRGLASQKIAKSWDLNINAIIKPIILYIWCTVLNLLLAGFCFVQRRRCDTGRREENEKKEEVQGGGGGGKNALYVCSLTCMRNISKWVTLLIFDVVSITFDWKWMNLWIIEYVMFFHKSFVLSRRQWCLSYVCFCMPRRGAWWCTVTAKARQQTIGYTVH